MSNVFFMIGLFISIHAPTRGATIDDYDRMMEEINFNPRSYKRSDNKDNIAASNLLISIHAPTRGATAKMHNNPYTYL